MTFFDVAKTFIELGFPVAVSIFLLWLLTKQIERFRNTLIDVKIGLHLILARLGVLEEYEDALKKREELKK